MKKIFQKFKNWLILTRARLHHRFKHQDSDITIGRGGLKDLKRVLLCIPADTGLTPGVQSFIGNLKQQHAGLIINLLVPKGIIDRYQKMPGADLVIPWDENNLTWLGFPYKRVLTALAQNWYGMVIDYNRPLHFPIAYLVHKLNAPYRLGIKSEYSSYFYNVEIVPQTTDCFDMILKMLAVF